MPYLLTTTFNKPDNTQWFAQQNPDEHAEFMNWVNSFPGVLGMTGKAIDAHTFERIIVFENKESCEAFKIARDTHEKQSTRLAHATTNSITFTYVETEV